MEGFQGSFVTYSSVISSRFGEGNTDGADCLNCACTSYMWQKQSVMTEEIHAMDCCQVVIFFVEEYFPLLLDVFK